MPGIAPPEARRPLRMAIGSAQRSRNADEIGACCTPVAGHPMRHSVPRDRWRASKPAQQRT
jgi:hypothetical protein